MRSQLQPTGDGQPWRQRQAPDCQGQEAGLCYWLLPDAQPTLRYLDTFKTRRGSQHRSLRPRYPVSAGTLRGVIHPSKRVLSDFTEKIVPIASFVLTFI